jgi:hypothetical protein
MPYDISDDQRAKLTIRHQYDLVSRPRAPPLLCLHMRNLMGG